MLNPLSDELTDECSDVRQKTDVNQTSSFSAGSIVGRQVAERGRGVW